MENNIKKGSHIYSSKGKFLGVVTMLYANAFETHLGAFGKFKDYDVKGNVAFLKE